MEYNRQQLLCRLVKFVRDVCAFFAKLNVSGSNHQADRCYSDVSRGGLCFHESFCSVMCQLVYENIRTFITTKISLN